jgi:calcium/calmodulin-dependent protein kinase I
MAQIRFSSEEYYRNYEELRTLGEGCIGLVKSIKRISDEAKFAVKQVTTDDEEIVRNVAIFVKSSDDNRIQKSSQIVASQHNKDV